MTRLRNLVVLGLAAMVTLCTGALSGEAFAATAPVWPAAGALTLPSSPSAATTLPSIDCATVGTCFAVGSFTDSSGTVRPLAVGETAGTFGGGVQVAAPNSGPASLSSVSCPGTGNCTAVGSAGTQPFVAVATNGNWSDASAPALPNGAGGGQLSGIDCANTTSCVAVGGDGNGQPLAAAESGGTWATATELGLPADAATTGQQATLRSVSCTSPGNCVAVGSYLSTGGQTQPMTIVEQAGTWAASATRVALPAGASGGALDSVSCTGTSSCNAAGDYLNSIGQTLPAVVTINATTGVPGTAGGLAVPTGTEAATLDSISCTGAAECVTTGSQVSSGTVAPATASESAGTWTAVSSLSVPAGAVASGALNGSTLAVDCRGVDGCSAVGTYPVSGGVGAMALNSHSSLVITTTSVPQATVGKAYSVRLSAAGGAGTEVWSLSGGTLPPGLSLSASGTISGTPTTTAAVGFSVTVRDDANPPDSATASFGLAVAPPPPAKPTATKGTTSTHKKHHHKSGKGKHSAARVRGANASKLRVIGGDAVRLKVQCVKDRRCAGSVTINVLEHIRNGKVVKVTPDARRPRVTLKQLTLGSVKYSLRRGRSVKLTIDLNARGRRMLSAHKRLKVGLTLRPTRPRHSAAQLLKPTLTLKVVHANRRHHGTHHRSGTAGRRSNEA